MWKNFESVLKHCRRVGATVLIEWPRSCDYWKHEQVQKALFRNRFQYTEFDGCMYGLRPLSE
eukprot:8758465-Lingulodinium_polyedra.AAC.1